MAGALGTIDRAEALGTIDRAGTPAI